MKDSIKANLIVFLIIATIAFTVSSAFASLTITEDNDSYKLSAIKNDSFEPNNIEEVPTIIPKVENKTNDTNLTNTTIEDWNDTWEDNYNNTLDDLEFWEND
ncbi:MAG: hypothetical protein U0L42_03285 [Methanobrevibacter sp.]|uniref:hypothetical protein n=1 Tax=Methanobrevibacter sp. TaxID=66852 RepID=UPI002E785C7C|nr:hypothetical protein [Methanobrevibacter sp.]MEE0934675.1 hypothetical protein [Methanobrevibacter sp.]